MLARPPGKPFIVWTQQVPFLQSASHGHPQYACVMQERSRIVVHPVLVDVVGSCIAALSMLWAILAIYMGQVRPSLHPPGTRQSLRCSSMHACALAAWVP